MRRIDLTKLNPSASWLARATAKQNEVNSGISEAKNVGNIWAELKPNLKALSHNKCWYCESREDRSDNAVDHFRPKSLYPWLACDHRNFRFSCTFCNSVRKNPETGEAAGKGDHFPLITGNRATNLHECSTEAHSLIDPCKPSDVSLLTFKEDGKPYPNYPTQKKRAQRAIDSIRYYHLDHPDLNEARRELALQLEEWIDGADALYDKNDQMDPRQQKAFDVFVTSIGRAIDKSAPFSMFAMKMIKGHRDKPWVDDILDCA
ncbi:MAG: hypothetical protein R3254_07650 [Thiomicrorhabdus sp.]|nr:hypothetical protein [Thiomicrorhabdus sp.]